MDAHYGIESYPFAIDPILNDERTEAAFHDPAAALTVPHHQVLASATHNILSDDLDDRGGVLRMLNHLRPGIELHGNLREPADVPDSTPITVPHPPAPQVCEALGLNPADAIVLALPALCANDRVGPPYAMATLAAIAEDV